ncbi:MAG: hypothetical protein GY938_11310 [Ketobacter sp.]|nr:hypothetical protein [Ketobacter sp.]
MGYDQNVVQWSDESDSKPSANDNGSWLRSESTPKPGEKRVVYITAPFSEPEGESFWCRYIPALSHWNGWVEHPEELEKSAFIKCNVLNVIEQSEHEAWVIVSVIESVCLNTALSIYSPKHASIDFIRSLWKIEQGSFHLLGNWIYYDCFDGGSNGYSMLFRISEDGVCHLVNYTETAPHCSASYFGNLIVNKEFIDELAGRSFI